MTTKAIGDWLDATIESDLSVTCKLGWPAFDRPDIAAGAYLRLRQSDPVYGERISSSVDRFAKAYDVLVVTANEVAMWAMVDLLEATIKARTTASAGGTSYRLTWDTIERADNPYENDALRFAVQTTVFVR